MSDSFEMNGPYRFKMDFGVVTKDGRNAAVTYQFGWSELPTVERIEEVEEELLEQVENQLGMPVRPMTKEEYWDYVCGEKGLGKFALPGGEGWD